MTSGAKLITVICPVFNEEAYIRNILEFFLNAPPANKELILIDGGSTDTTVSIIEEYASRHGNIRLMHNPGKFVPFALNMAIQGSVGDPVIRLDAHTEYDSDYFNAVLRCFDKSGADIVGGPMRAEGKSGFQKAVAYATSTKLGVGDSGFHDESQEGFTESVYLGSWRRYIFEKTGLFDTDMLRNQDDEFHYRARREGFTIYLDPSIKSKYYPRSSPKSLFRQYYQYGLFKPLVLKKVRTGLRIRHLIPSCFFIYLLSLPLSLLFWWWILPGALYFILMGLFALRSSLPLVARIELFRIYPLLHISYGAGFLKGLFLLFRGRKPIV
jgi:glycosyltransferase involved in cell wall biosynthesis